MYSLCARKITKNYHFYKIIFCGFLVQLSLSNKYKKKHKMSYWFDQPVNVDKSQNVEIHNIIVDPSTTKTVIPECFEFKTVTARHYKIVHAFLCKNYIQDKLNIVKLIYHEDFVYWYLNNISLNFAVALVYNKNIIGFITALFIQVEINNKIIDMPYINFLCVDKKLRNCNLGPLLIDEIKKRICQKGINYALFTSMSNPTTQFCTSRDYIVPINFDKLRRIGFITDIDNRNLLKNNPLCLMQKNEINIVLNKLNNYYKDLKIKIYFNSNSKYLINSKKNIVYSFVCRDTNGAITDFVNFYKYYYYCMEKNEIISVAKLGFYFCEKLSITELIECLIDKLPLYKIDQLSVSDMGFNDQINITKFSTTGKLHCFFYNLNTSYVEPCNLMLLPI